jgi:hypothetical protein
MSAQNRLHEDQMSTPHPRCHAKGLVAFCRENPRLRIEHLVNLWTCALDCARWIPPRALYVIPVTHFATTPFPGKLSQVITAIASWIVEANALSALGMPEGAFTLLFDGEPYSEHGVVLFKAVKWAACDQLLQELDIARMRQNDAPTWTEHRESPRYHFEGFPKAIDDIVRGKSIVKCNFDVGDSWFEEDAADLEEISINRLREIMAKNRTSMSMSF